MVIDFFVEEIYLPIPDNLTGAGDGTPGSIVP
jgi:hypothetical protein